MTDRSHSQRTNEIIKLAVVVFALVAIDQGSKAVATSALVDSSFFENVKSVPICPDSNGNSPRQALIKAHSKQIEIVRGLLVLRYQENCDGAFNLLAGLPESIQYLVFVTVSLIPLFVLIWFCWRGWQNHEAFAPLSMAIISGGSLGNLFDWLTTRYVVDFIVLKFGSCRCRLLM